ncbi:DUF106 domain-containing protein [Candidatus Woesearchaeota archaeon]|nr:DUF106 domain-containing protein [Candidatus Woesearchaeota archaeon]
MLNAIFDPILGPLLKLPSLVAILTISLAMSALITVVYKLLTDQNLMKDLRNEINDLQKELKTLKNNPKKAMKVQSQMMETNSKYMMHSMRPTLFTFLPVILIFSWFNTHLGYYPLQPDNPFDVIVMFDKEATGTAVMQVSEGLTALDEKSKEIISEKLVWHLKGTEGRHNLTIIHNNKDFSKDLLITEKREYINPIQKVRGNSVKEIIVGNERIYPFGDLSFFGWRPGWLGTYIIFSLVFSMALRKLLKIY